MGEQVVRVCAASGGAAVAAAALGARTAGGAAAWPATAARWRGGAAAGESAQGGEGEEAEQEREEGEEGVDPNSVYVYLKAGFFLALPASHGQSGKEGAQALCYICTGRTVGPAPKGSGLPVPILQGGSREEYCLSHLMRASLAS